MLGCVAVMTPLMETLYRYLVETKLDAFLLQYPEYPDYLRCTGEKEGQLRARLEPGEARLLDDLLGELRLGHATEREAVFQASLALSRELGELA